MMHSASREALASAKEFLDNKITDSITATNVGSELFQVVEILDGDRPLRVAVADASAPAEQRTGLIRSVFAGKVAGDTLEILEQAAGLTWSNPREMRGGVVQIARLAFFKAAKLQGQLEQVESELWQLARILDREPQLTQLLTDATATAAQKRDLLAKVLYGKVTAVTEALALQVAGRKEKSIVDDIADLSKLAAQTEGRIAAAVTSATRLTETQRATLAEKLARIYGSAVTIHEEVDASLLGGAVIRINGERIDGSVAAQFRKLREALA